MRTETGTAVLLSNYRPSDFTIPQTHLLFDLSPSATRVTATLSVQRAGNASDKLVLDGDELQLVSVAIDGETLSSDAYIATPEQLTLTSLPAAEQFTVEIVTQINPQTNKQLMGLYRTGGNYCTQCEAEGFRRITYFLDRPDILSVYTVRIEGDAEDTPQLLSNGNKIAEGELENGRIFAEWHDPHPKPSYLFALFAGNLAVIHDRFTTMNGRDVALEIYVEHGKEKRATYAMDALKRSMEWDETRFGREYDLDVFMLVAVSDFNMGAMENKGLNVFNDKYVLADPATATDTDYANIEAIIGHEYFHNWTGNRITCRDWFQLCLKEGLTVYRDQEFSSDMRSREVKRISAVRTLKAHQFPEDAGPLAHPVRPRIYKEINNFYTATVYEKGSEVVRMLQTVLGDDGFNAGLNLYFDRHDGDAATIEDFLACFAEATGADLSQFALWYDQPGTPNLAITTDYDAAEKRFTVQVRQSLKPPVKGAPHKAMHIPLRFGLVGPDGCDMSYTSVSGADITGDVAHIKAPAHTIVFEGVAEKPVLSALRGFSAPVTLFPPMSGADAAFLARHDNDGFNRWNALETLKIRLLKHAYEHGGAGDAAELTTLCEIMQDITSDDRLDAAYRALCLSLPNDSDIAREISADVDTTRVSKARSAVRTAIALACERVMARHYHALQPRGEFQPTADDAGRRALRGACLDYLCVASGSVDLAVKALDEADNMTDRMAALTIIVHQAPDSEAAAKALDDFRVAFRSDGVVMDKWLTLQATIPSENALERVKTLINAPEFSWETPNRVRSLIGAFSSANPVSFNRADGAGYEFLCQSIARLDAINPQVAARVLTAMRSWSMMEAGRRELARKHLQWLAERPHLSRDVSDIVERTLSA